MNLFGRGRTYVAVATALFYLAPAVVHADDVAGQLGELERVLPALTAEQREELLATGELSRTLTEGDTLALVPTTQQASTMDAGFAEIGYTVGVEVLFLLPDTREQYTMAQLATKLLGVSTLGGVQYYSASRGRMRTLIDDSYTIDSAEYLNRIPDTVVTDNPSDGIVHVFQRDTTFGWNANTITYSVDESSFSMMTTNDSAFDWAFIPIIQAGHLHSYLLLIRSENFMVYYANFGARALSVNFFERRIHDSFYNRIVALKGWFEAKLVD